MQNEGLHHVTRPRRQSKFAGVVLHAFLQAKATHLKKCYSGTPSGQKVGAAPVPVMVNADEHGVAHPRDGTFVGLEEQGRAEGQADASHDADDTALSERTSRRGERRHDSTRPGP